MNILGIRANLWCFSFKIRLVNRGQNGYFVIKSELICRGINGYSEVKRRLSVLGR